ncbi:uncharacterized protein [Leptinotarsa decemlineata]|uniref:uncharacterized protein n=1 Tax=Leptinotarsa decemlineata TaxID=7539 RepID=UPI003D30CA2E
MRDGKYEDVPVCRKAFIHGTTKRRIEHIVMSLKLEGQAPTDGRGKHKNRPHKLSEAKVAAVKNHIASFKGRNAHYSLQKTSKIFLPEELNVKKMHLMYMEKHPGLAVSYESYRSNFVKNFNISFGYPRINTCSFCDETKAKISALEADLTKGL